VTLQFRLQSLILLLESKVVTKATDPLFLPQPHNGIIQFPDARVLILILLPQHYIILFSILPCFLVDIDTKLGIGKLPVLCFNMRLQVTDIALQRKGFVHGRAGRAMAVRIVGHRSFSHRVKRD